MVRGFVAVLVLALPALRAQQGAQQEAFERELERLQRQVQNGAYAAAYSGLEKLLTAHQDQDYARMKRAEVELLHRRCSFRLASPPPDPKQLVSGELLAFDLPTGTLKIRYGKDNLADWVQDGTMRTLDLRFVGPHSIELRGARYQPLGPALAEGALVSCCREEGRSFDLHGGLAGVRLPELARADGDKRALAAKGDRSPLESGRPYRIQLKIDGASIRAFGNGLFLLEAKKGPAEWGTVAFGNVEFDEVVVEGRAEPSWLQERIDTELHGRLRSFERRYDPRHELPEWLWLRPRRAGLDDSSGEAWPDQLDETQQQIVREAERLYARRELEFGLRYVQGYPRLSLPDATHAALQLGFLTSLDRFEEANRAAERLALLAPEVPLAVALRAELQIALGRGDRALPLLAPLAQQLPAWERVQVDLALARMSEGELLAAKRGVDQARANGVDGPELTALNRTLIRTLQGPDWARVHAWRSERFEVLSDIDAATCKRAAELLESTQVAIGKQLRLPPRASRSRVYLFAGPEGFHRYVEELWGTRICPNVSGLYHPLLKQLLVCNLPRRDEMLVTIRHEGVHQMLDRLAPSAPVWLNEGLACYYERATIGGTSVVASAPDPAHVAWLKAHPLVPVAELMARSPEAFYGDAEQSYSQAHALVSLLLDTKPEYRKRLDTLLRELTAGGLPEAAQRKAFAGLAPNEIDADLAAHVRAWR